jgi:hypothetical protein
MREIWDRIVSELGIIVGGVQHVLDAPGMQLAKWLLALVVLVYAFRIVVPTWRILALSLYRDLPWSLSRSFVDLLKLGWMGINREHWYQVARLRVEWELLQQRPEPPGRHLALQRPGETLAAARARFRGLYRRYREDLDVWKNRLNDHLAAFVRPNHDEVTIDVEDCSQIYARADAIRNYFGVLATDRSAHRQSADSFISQVRVKRGFVAPLHLVSGLLAECEDDWGPVIEDYGRQVAQPLPAIPGADGLQRFASRDGELRLQRLQTFLFDCWLLWGPSIPICTCEAWYAGRPVLQFGFGDENNSLALLFEDPIPVEQLRRFFSGEHVRGTALAVKTTNVVGHVQWGPSIDSHEIAEAQQSVCAPDEERLALRVRNLPIYGGGDNEESSARYYSAYLWVMFVIGKTGFQPLYDEEPWRGILPFFEHGNIAEAQSLAIAKQQLAVKTLTTVQSLLDEMPNLHLRFVCAIDQSCCGCSLLVAPPAGEAMHELLQQSIETNPAFSRLRDGGTLASRLSLDPACWRDGDYCSCHLPDLIAGYYASLDEPDRDEQQESPRDSNGKKAQSAAALVR